MNKIGLVFSSLVFFLFACGNSQQNNGVANAVVKTDSIKTLDSNKVENTQTTSLSKSIDELLKSGQKGIFEDSTFSAIIENDFAVHITNPAFHVYDIDEFTYKVTTYLKEGTNWKVESEREILSDKHKYKTYGSEIKITDMDDDGKKDIMLLMANDGKGNHQYILLLVKDKKLIEIGGFDKVRGPAYDKKKKLIEATAVWHGGHGTETYQIVNDSLFFIEGVSIDYDRDSGYDIVHKYTTKIKK